MKPSVSFIDRRDAGRHLEAEVAAVLGRSFDILLVRKLGVPGHEEYAMGAIAGGGVKVLDLQVVSELGLSEAQVSAVIDKESRELARRETLYRGERPEPAVVGRSVILVDDGIATGSTITAAITLLRMRGAGRVVVAAPVDPQDCRPAIARKGR